MLCEAEVFICLSVFGSLAAFGLVWSGLVWLGFAWLFIYIYIFVAMSLVV